nr:sugar porter family MFS transporter [Halobacillus salinarum]
MKTKTMDHRKFLFIIIIVSTFGGLLFGYDTGVINGALPYMSDESQLNLTAFTEGIVTSVLLFGAAIGAVLGGRVSDWKGRKTTIIYLAGLFFISTIGCTFAPNVEVMVLCRFLLGLAVGGASVTVPTYLAEMAPVESRGRMVTQNELMIVTGQLMAFTINAILGTSIGDNAFVWRIMLSVAAVPALLLFFGMLRLPESPRYLVGKNKTKQAGGILDRIRQDGASEGELSEIVTAVASERHIKKATYRDLTVPWVRRILFIGLGIAVVQQITGVNSIMYYGTEILRDAGFATEAALVANIANGVISVLATFVGIWLLGKIGRRPMLLAGQIGTVGALLLIGIFSFTMEGSTALPYVIISLTVTFLAFQQGAISPVTWLMLSEIFPLRLRGLGMGVSVFVLWMVNFLIGFSFPILLEGLGLSTTFFIFAFLGVLAIAFVAKFLPETKGKTLEELEQYFRNYKSKGEDVPLGKVSASK